jgi:hypothetical protein
VEVAQPVFARIVAEVGGGEDHAGHTAVGDLQKVGPAGRAIVLNL